MVGENVKGLQHLGLPSGCLERTVAFYRLLGFSVIRNETIPNSGQPVAFLSMKNIIIEAYQQDSEDGSRAGWNHIALDVSDIEEAWRSVSASGIKICEKEIQFLPFWKNGVKYFNIEGPDRETIEFVQKI